MDSETPPHISELNSAIALLRLENAIALFSSEMCWGVSESTSQYVLLDQGVSVPVSCAFAKLVGVDCVQAQSRGVAQCVQKTLCT